MVDEWLAAVLLLGGPPVLWVLASVYIQDRNAKSYGLERIRELQKRINEFESREKEHIRVIAWQQQEIDKLKAKIKSG